MARTKQRYEPWEIRDFSAGVVEKLNDNILPDNAAHECRNFTSNRFGGLSKRKGQERLNSTPLPAMIQGLHPYYSNSGHTRYLITMSGGLGYLWNGEDFEMLSFEGAESLVGAASFPHIGTSLWGETMFNHPYGVFPLTASGPVIFENAVNEIVAMNGIDQPWKWDGAAITFLSAAPAKGRYPVLHKEKLFCVDANEPSTVVWSETFDVETWPAYHYWDIRKGDGDEITCLIRFVDELFIFKNRSLHSLKGTSLDDFSLQEISATVGCVGPRAAVAHDLKVFFISEHGIYTTNGLNVLNVSEMIIPEIWKKVNKQFLHRATVTVWEDLIWFAVPFEGSATNNLVLTYDVKKQAFFPMSGINPSCFAYYHDGTGGGVKLYSGDTQHGYINIQDQGYNDFDQPVEAYWRGKFFDMGKPEVEKKSRMLFIQDSPLTEEIADIAVCRDYEKKDGDLYYNNLVYSRTEGYTREFKFDKDANRWRYLSPKIIHNNLGPCEIRGLAMPYKPKTRLAVRHE